MVASWSKYGNILINRNRSNFNFSNSKVFIDQPACVGFSYSTNINDCNTSDTQAASVNIRAIKKFLHTVMPRYKVCFFPFQIHSFCVSLNKGREFWFTGESYAGAYVPMLSALVVDDPDLNSNFVGFMVGNPVMECFDKVSVRSYTLFPSFSQSLPI